MSIPGAERRNRSQGKSIEILEQKKRAYLYGVAG
jgi:hypothetical protein